MKENLCVWLICPSLNHELTRVTGFLGEYLRAKLKNTARRFDGHSPEIRSLKHESQLPPEISLIFFTSICQTCLIIQVINRTGVLGFVLWICAGKDGIKWTKRQKFKIKYLILFVGRPVNSPSPQYSKHPVAETPMYLW